MKTLHPATRIFCFVVLAVLLQGMVWQNMLGLFCGILLLQWPSRCRIFLQLLMRARWLLFSMLLIYALATPGEYLPGWPDCCAPTYEGMQQGGLQALRLLLMFSALSLVLSQTTREELIAGIMVWLRPFKPFGISSQRFAVRLWLTLHYVENTPPGLVRRLRISGWHLERLLDEVATKPEPLKIPLFAWSFMDALMVLIMAIFLWRMV